MMPRSTRADSSEMQERGQRTFTRSGGENWSDTASRLKMGPTEMRAEIIRLHRESKMRSLAELLRAVAETQVEYWEKILAARRGKERGAR